MTSATPEVIKYEPGEACPLGVSVVAGLQGVAMVLTTMVLVVAITVRAGGSAEVGIWAVFASLVIAGAMTALQAVRLGRFGSGHVLIMGPTVKFAALGALALAAGGPGLLASLVIACMLVHLVLALGLPRVRRIITPTVSGTMVMLIAVTLLPFALEPMRKVPAGSPPAAGAVIALVTLAFTIALTWRAKGAWRLWSPVLAIVAGTAVAIPFGAVDFTPVLDAAWIGFVRPELPGLDLSLGIEFWSLLPAFVLVATAEGIRNIGDAIAVQQAAQRSPRATDFRLVQGSLTVEGLSFALSGIVGAPPTISYGAETVSLTTFTGVAARRVGVVFGVILLLLACSPKLMTVFITLPEPVVGIYMLVMVAMMFVNGVKMVVHDGLDIPKAMLVGVSFCLGVALDAQSLGTELFGTGSGMLLDHGIVAGALCALLMSASMRFLGTSKRRVRLDVPLAMSSLPAIDGFMQDLADVHGWNDSTSRSLRGVSEEMLIILIESIEQQSSGAPSQPSGTRSQPSGDQQHPLDGVPSLIVRAQPQGELVELEFMAVLDTANIEDRLAYLSDEAVIGSEIDVSDLPLRLLRHYADSAKHQKYYGLDVITVWIRATQVHRRRDDPLALHQE